MGAARARIQLQAARVAGRWLTESRCADGDNVANLQAMVHNRGVSG